MKISEFIKIADFSFLKKENTSESEFRSWNKSLPILQEIFKEMDLGECEIELEYKLPYSHDRVDVVLIGKNIIFLELKQWSDDRCIEQKNFCIVDNKELLHPCKQVDGYKRAYEIYCDGLGVKTAVFLHNMNKPFKYCKTDIFYKNSITEFKEFLKENLLPVDKNLIEKFKTCIPKPTPKLLENLDRLEEVIQLSFKQREVIYKIINSKKNVILVEGVPGSGKSLIALMLHRYFYKKGKMSLYFTKTKTPRHVFTKILNVNKSSEAGIIYLDGEDHKLNEIENKNTQYIIVDEAQRLNKNHINYLKKLNKKLIFFYDSKQKIKPNDIGDVSKYFKEYDKFVLEDQYRCDISKEYLDFIDYVLYDKGRCKKFDYDFRICDSFEEFMNLKKELKAKIVSGYCFNWESKKNINSFDIEIENFKLKWNDFKNSSIWIVDEKQQDLVGCIHSVQGMEEDYIGVIVCDDLGVKNNKLIELPKNNEEYKKSFEEGLIKNIYRVLLSRARKGTFVYFTNEHVKKYFKDKLNDCLSK